MERLLLQCLCIRHDLQEAKANVQEKGLLLSIAYIKSALFAFNNLCALERRIRYMYTQHRVLSEQFDTFKKNAELFSYLRNKFAGHLTNDLVEKALEWKPELKMMLDQEYEPTLVSAFHLFLLETAINTYVDVQGRHKLFDSETDLMYPPDEKRFRDTLLHSIDDASEFLLALEKILRPQTSLPETRERKFERFIKAGNANFEFLRKRKR